MQEHYQTLQMMIIDQVKGEIQLPDCTIELHQWEFLVKWRNNYHLLTMHAKLVSIQKNFHLEPQYHRKPIFKNYQTIRTTNRNSKSHQNHKEEPTSELQTETQNHIRTINRTHQDPNRYPKPSQNYILSNR